MQEFAALAPCYLTGLYTLEYLGQGSKGTLSDDIIFLPSNCTYEWSNSYATITGKNNNYASQYSFAVNGTSYATVKASLVTSSYVKIANAGDTVYLHSTDRNAYPDSGTVDGIMYTYLGRPFEKFPTVPQIESGSYIGTGTYGDSSPNRLTFEFMPKFVQIRTDDMYSAYIFTDMTLVRGVKTTVASRWYRVYGTDDAMLTMGSGSGSNSVKNDVTWGDTFVEFYALPSSVSGTRDWFQMNASGKTYHYIAIG